MEPLCEPIVLCNFVLRVASGPSVKLAACKRALNPPTPPVVYSTDRSKAMVLVLFLLFVALCRYVVPALLSVFYMCCDASIVNTVFNIAHFAFCFTSSVMMLAFWSPSTAAHFALCFTSCD